MSTFEELLVTRRSIRQFQERDVDLKTIHAIIKDSTMAPSASHMQPWKFVIVNDRATMKRISDESKKNLLSENEANPRPGAQQYIETLQDESFNVFYNAPCLVIIVGSKERNSLSVDCALAASYLMLSAASRGLGTCWIGLGSRIEDPRMLDELGIPEDCRIVAPIILGYPKEIPPVRERNAPEILRIIS